MSIHKDDRRNTYYFVASYKDTFGKSQRYRSKDYKTKKEAKQAEVDFFIKLQDATPDYMTYQYAYDHYLKYNVLQPKTLTNKRHYHEKHILPFFAHLKLSEMSKEQVEAFRQYCIDTFKSLNTARAVYTTFRTVINHSIKHLNNKNNPCIGVKAIPRQEVNKGVLTLEEMQEGLEKFRNIDYRDMTILMFYTGIRLGECLAIKWRYVDLDNNEIFLAGNINDKTNDYSTILKTKNSRTYVPLPKVAVEMLQNRYEIEFTKHKYFNDEYFIFGGIKNYWADNYRNAFKEVYKKERVTPHSLRHSFAKHLLDKGIPMYDLKDLMRHDDIKTTINTYAHFDRIGKHKSMKYFD